MSNGLKSLFDLYIQEKRFLANLSEKTLAQYTEIFKRYEKFSDVSQLPTDVFTSRLVIGIRQGEMSPITCNISIRAINSFLYWLHEKGDIPALKMKQLKIENKVGKIIKRIAIVNTESVSVGI